MAYIYIYIERERERKLGRQAEGKMSRQADRQTGRQVDGWTGVRTRARWRQSYPGNPQEIHGEGPIHEWNCSNPGQEAARAPVFSAEGLEAHRLPDGVGTNVVFRRRATNLIYCVIFCLSAHMLPHFGICLPHVAHILP